MISKKWIAVLVIAVIILTLILPIWCNTYYLPTPEQTVVEKTVCGPIWDLLKVY